MIPTCPRVVECLLRACHDLTTRCEDEASRVAATRSNRRFSSNATTPRPADDRDVVRTREGRLTSAATWSEEATAPSPWGRAARHPRRSGHAGTVPQLSVRRFGLA